MSEYRVEIEGMHDLEQITLQIVGEEAGASEFVNSQMSTRDNRLTNLVTFRELPAGTVPKQLSLIKQGDSQPPGTQHVWSGIMAVQGTTLPVAAYRSS